MGKPAVSSSLPSPHQYRLFDADGKTAYRMLLDLWLPFPVRESSVHRSVPVLGRDQRSGICFSEQSTTTEREVSEQLTTRREVLSSSLMSRGVRAGGWTEGQSICRLLTKQHKQLQYEQIRRVRLTRLLRVQSSLFTLWLSVLFLLLLWLSILFAARVRSILFALRVQVHIY
jgi:hypothetical protein